MSLDQSFHVKNLSDIYDLENRKGNNLAKKFFPELHEFDTKSKDLRNNISQVDKLLKKNYPLRHLKNFYWKKIQERNPLRKKITIAELEKVSDRINDRKFIPQIALTETSKNGKTIYKISDSSPEVFFVSKHTQRCLKKIYEIKPSNRNVILKQIKVLLEDNIPKIIMRTDIQKFYENIPSDKLLNLIKQDNLLSPTLKKFISHLLTQYQLASKSKLGIPRGVGISAYLAELYIRKFDKGIRKNQDILYYARYVDDIIIITKPDYKKEDLEVFVRQHIEKIDLSIHPIGTSKTQFFELNANNIKFQFDYLGYTINKQSDNVSYKLNQSKKDKYKKRIEICLYEYEKSRKNENKARRLLIKRLKFLTSNTRLPMGNKGHIFTGIYFSHLSNLMIDDVSTIECLDKIYQHLVESFLNQHPNIRWGDQIKHLSFTKGYAEKTFRKYSPSELKDITKAWKNGSEK